MVTGCSKLGDEEGLLTQGEDEMQRISAADADGGMLEVTEPEGIIAGDVMKVETSSGVLNVPVPEGAEPGTVLMFDPRVA